MGSSESKPTREEENRRRMEVEQQEQQQRVQQEERKRKQQEELLKKEEQKRQLEELQRKRSEDEEMKRKEKEREDKVREYNHLEEMQKLKDLEQGNQRKDALSEKENQLEHERLTHGQEHMFEILKTTFGKVKELDIHQAVYSAYIMQSIQSGKSIDKDVLAVVAAKVPTPPLPNLEQIVENVIQKCDEGDYDDDYMGRHGHSTMANQA